MAIPDEDVAAVRAATDIVALIGEQAPLRRQGRRWVARCPFHSEKTPSFSVNAEEGFYYCFGCQKSGDAITFVREVEHLDFVEAVRYLADKAGITLHEDEGSGVERKRRAELFEAMEKAVAWYHDRLLSAPDAGRARDYLRSRGYDGAVVRRFRLGWAPEDWDALTRALRLPERVVTAAGLGFVNRRGRMQDAFRGRVIFPICDPTGRAVALGGRVLPPPAGPSPAAPGHPEPKYKNSQESAIYAKRRTLYALNWAKHDIVASGEVVVCEGYTDVIGCFGAGVPRAVATCGTALAEEHFTLLRNFARRIVLAYDADSAGQSATSRVYEWERRHEVDVAVALLPPGSDPGELARRDPEALRKAVAEARPFLQFRVDRVFESAELGTAEGRARAAEAALAAVAEHPDELVRDQYVMQVSDRCRLEPELVRQRLADLRRRGADPSGRRAADRAEPHGANHAPDDRRTADDAEPPARRSGRRPVGDRPGLEALRLAVHRPEAMADRLEEVLFVDDLQRRAFRALTMADSLQQAVENAAPDVADLLRRVTVEEPLVPDVATVDPVDAVVTQLVREASRRALGDLQAALRAAGPGADLQAMAGETATARLWLEELDDPAGGRGAADRLVAWLLGRRQEGA
ncbi:MAG: DNA primase [Acidimicrobiales bacterium]